MVIINNYFMDVFHKIMFFYKKSQEQKSLYDTYVDIHKNLFTNNKKNIDLSRVKGKELEDLINSYRVLLKNDLIKYYKTLKIENKEIILDYFLIFAPNYKFKSSKEDISKSEIIKLVNDEKYRINNTLKDLQSQYIFGVDSNFYNNLNNILLKYTNKLDSILELDTSKNSNYNYTENKFQTLINQGLYFIKYINDNSIDKKPILNDYNKFFIVRQKGFDIDGDLENIVNRIKSYIKI